MVYVCDLCGGRLGDFKSHRVGLPCGNKSVEFTLRGRECTVCFQIICTNETIDDANESLASALESLDD